jgi:hypothetical protein
MSMEFKPEAFTFTKEFNSKEKFTNFTSDVSLIARYTNNSLVQRTSEIRTDFGSLKMIRNQHSSIILHIYGPVFKWFKPNGGKNHKMA